MPPQNTTLKAVLVGETGVGKTSLMHRYDKPTRVFSTRHRPTIEADFMVKELDVEGQKITFMIWDSSGQERFQSLGTAFYRGSECCILVFDVTSSKSFEALEKWKDNFFENARVRDPERFPVVVLGNKVDEDPEKREVSKEQAKEWCRENGNLTYFETSAKECVNVEEAFTTVAVAALEQSLKDGNFEKYGHEEELEGVVECKMCVCQ